MQRLLPVLLFAALVATLTNCSSTTYVSCWVSFDNPTEETLTVAFADTTLILAPGMYIGDLPCESGRQKVVVTNSKGEETLNETVDLPRMPGPGFLLLNVSQSDYVQWAMRYNPQDMEVPNGPPYDSLTIAGETFYGNIRLLPASKLLLDLPKATRSGKMPFEILPAVVDVANEAALEHREIILRKQDFVANYHAIMNAYNATGGAASLSQSVGIINAVVDMINHAIDSTTSVDYARGVQMAVDPLMQSIQAGVLTEVEVLALDSLMQFVQDVSKTPHEQALLAAYDSAFVSWTMHQDDAPAAPQAAVDFSTFNVMLRIHRTKPAHNYWVTGQFVGGQRHGTHQELNAQGRVMKAIDFDAVH